MNFFESQDRVRKHTFQLVLLFGLAVVTLIIMVNFLAVSYTHLTLPTIYSV